VIFEQRHDVSGFSQGNAVPVSTEIVSTRAWTTNGALTPENLFKRLSDGQADCMADKPGVRTGYGRFEFRMQFTLASHDKPEAELQDRACNFRRQGAETSRFQVRSRCCDMIGSGKALSG